MALLDNAALAGQTRSLPEQPPRDAEGPTTGIVIINREGLILEADDQVAGLSGLAPAQILGQAISKLWPMTAERLLALAKSPRRAESLKLEELPGCHIQTSPLPGEAEGLIISVFDLSPYQAVGEAGFPADPMTPYYKRIFETSPDGISICDDQGLLVLVNQASADQTGLPVSELLGRHVSSLIAGGYQDRSVCLDVLKTKKPVTMLVRRLETPSSTPPGRSSSWS